MATALCAKVVPEVGGDTVFASMSAAYEGLSARMRGLIDGLQAVHDMKPFKQIFEDTPEDREQLRRFEAIYPPIAHPVVRVHPVTGRRVLFVNPQFTIRIKDMDERESASLLDTLFHQALIPELQYRLHWRPHTLALWDNRSVQHYAVHDYWPQTRIMDRVTVKGARPVGVAAADPATVQKPKKLIAGAVSHGAHKPHLVEDDIRGPAAAE
ncbi:MAG: TauD/TfdA family dioxygenase [Defluviicoccus sp.]|nr:TauD/TfdA family dioxygenase [Defluviicoccus sp.]MDE0384307.1 TauD/TfdA family dioxygenase [Defluviicoccus sp.]